MLKASANKKVVIPGVLILILISIFVLKGSSKVTPKSTGSNTQSNQNQTPEVVTTNPNPLDQSIISSTESFSVTFNLPVQNPGELKHTVEPKMDYTLKLSDDRKTAIFTPNKPLPIGMEYTLHITGDTKMDGSHGMVLLGQDLIYHIFTVPYHGV